jgi:hypothetical protein
MKRRLEERGKVKLLRAGFQRSEINDSQAQEISKLLPCVALSVVRVTQSATQNRHAAQSREKEMANYVQVKFCSGACRNRNWRIEKRWQLWKQEQSHNEINETAVPKN